MRINNFGKIAGMIAVAAMLMASSANATLTWTSPLTLNSPDVVGIVKGLNGDNPGSDEIAFAQHLLDLPAGTVNDSYVDPISGNAHIYNTSSTEYSGTLTKGIEGTTVTVASGWEYAIAKYDGKNAGYVLFYLGGSDATLPQYSYSIWGGNSCQYAISGYTTFNATAVPEPTTIIAGALLLLPFGASAMRILRRKA